MTKFDQIISEAETNVNSATLNQAGKAIENLPDQAKKTVNATFDKLGTQGGENHQLLTKMADIFNDKTPSKFSSLTPEEQKSALELLTKSGLEVKVAGSSPNSTSSTTTPTTPVASTTPASNTQPSNAIQTTVPGAVV
jgi:hypothetical protein